MPEPGIPAYQVKSTPRAIQSLKNLQQRAVNAGLGDDLLAALKTLHKNLQTRPFDLGEPLYHLKAIRAQVRICFTGPLAVHFAVYEEQSLVYIAKVDALSRFGL